MADALIGHSGFVGGSILRSRPFEYLYRSIDIDTIRGQSFDLLVCCGAPAEKWRANKDPEEDRARLATLTDALADVRAKHVVLISTIDVYPVPRGLDERATIDPALAQPYGRHRYELEEFFKTRFDTTIVRLPGLYGRGLKKNAIYDLLHGRPVDGVPGNASFQFYDTDRVWVDVERVLGARISLANITAEPVTMNDVAARVFGREMPTPIAESAAHYDIKSIHADLVGGHDGYWFDAEAVITGLQRFVDSERSA